MYRSCKFETLSVTEYVVMVYGFVCFDFDRLLALSLYLFEHAIL